jgi:hypothetical protein
MSRGLGRYGQSYGGFVPVPAYGGIYQSMKAVRWSGR